MERQRFSVAAIFAAALGIAVIASPVQAQKVGDSVSPKRQVNLKVKDEVKAVAKPGDVLTVERERDDWLWVKTADGKNGWVLKEDVVAAAPAPATPSKTTPPDAPPATGEPPVDERLYLIGAMGATQVYLTYAYVGAVGDGFVNKTYDSAKVQELMGEVTGMTDHLIKQLQRVRDSELTVEDRAALDQMIDINQLLKKQSEALAAYSRDSSQENARAFDDVRVEVWPKISALLGIKPGEIEEPGAPAGDGTGNPPTPGTSSGLGGGSSK